MISNKERFERLVQLEAIAAVAKADAEAYAAAWCDEVAPKEGETFEFVKEFYRPSARAMIITSRHLSISRGWYGDDRGKPVKAIIVLRGSRVLKDGTAGKQREDHTYTLDCTQ